MTVKVYFQIRSLLKTTYYFITFYETVISCLLCGYILTSCRSPLTLTLFLYQKGDQTEPQYRIKNNRVQHTDWTHDIRALL